MWVVGEVEAWDRGRAYARNVGIRSEKRIMSIVQNGEFTTHGFNKL